MCAKSLQWCLTLCDPMDCSPLDSSVHGILQARIRGWVAMLSSRGSPWPRDQACISHGSCNAGRFFTAEPQGKPNIYLQMRLIVAQTVKHLPTMRENWVQFLSQEDPLEKEMATNSSTLAWKVPWMENPSRLQSMGSQRVRYDLAI